MRRLLMTCLGLLLATGCGEDAERIVDPPAPPVYVANTSPDSLLANLVTAWGAMDAQAYAALLYDGLDLAQRDEDFPPFRFYFGQMEHQTLPTVWGYAEEIACAEHLLGGLQGEIDEELALPGVKSIAVLLMPLTAWEPETDPGPYGDPYPAGTQRLSARLQMLFDLEEAIAGGGYSILHLLAEEQAVLHCVPIVANERIEYRFWKWTELGAGLKAAVPDTPGDTWMVSLGSIKAWHAPAAGEGWR